MLSCFARATLVPARQQTQLETGRHRQTSLLIWMVPGRLAQNQALVPSSDPQFVQHIEPPASTGSAKAIGEAQETVKFPARRRTSTTSCSTVWVVIRKPRARSHAHSSLRSRLGIHGLVVSLAVVAIVTAGRLPNPSSVRSADTLPTFSFSGVAAEHWRQRNNSVPSERKYSNIGLRSQRRPANRRTECRRGRHLTAE